MIQWIELQIEIVYLRLLLLYFGLKLRYRNMQLHNSLRVLSDQQVSIDKLLLSSSQLLANEGNSLSEDIGRPMFVNGLFKQRQRIQIHCHFLQSNRYSTAEVR